MATEIRTRVEAFGLGWWLALLIGLLAIVLWALGQMSREQAMIVLAVCAVALR